MPGHPEPLPGPSLSPPLSQRVLVLDTICSHSLGLRVPDSPPSQSQCDLSLAQCSGCTFCCHSSMFQSLGPCWQHPPLEQSDTASPLCTAKWESAVFGSGTPESSVCVDKRCEMHEGTAGIPSTLTKALPAFCPQPSHLGPGNSSVS